MNNKQSSLDQTYFEGILSGGSDCPDYDQLQKNAARLLKWERLRIGDKRSNETNTESLLKFLELRKKI